MSHVFQNAPPNILTVHAARAAMLAHSALLLPETVGLRDGLGRILAAPVIAQRDHPPAAVSAMDGYAVRSADTPGKLVVIGEAAAGHPFDGHVSQGTAVRISTGAALPDGADTIVIQEDVRRIGHSLIVPQARNGRHIRAQGLDFTTGASLLQPGRALDSSALALTAASGAATLSVTRRPRIAILCSGDELVEPGSDAAAFQIYDSVSYGVAALVESWGGIANRMALEKDNAEALVRAARDGLCKSDLLVMIGGASVGEHDHARTALHRLGLELICAKVAVRPGKPTWFGTTSAGNVMGLPGNPASALVCTHLFLRPLMDAMLGRPQNHNRLRKAVTLEAVPENGNREHYLRAFLTLDESGALTARPCANQDSSLLSVFAAANGLIRRLPSAPPIPKGSLLDILITGPL